MPGQENNTDLLAGLNQLIVAMNELVTATNDQVLDVTVNNNVPVPDVTVNNDVPVPDVTVNFDTASIVSELSSIKDNTADLTNLQNISANSDHLSNLAELPNFTAGLTIANGHFANIADRLAPDGESIQPTLLLLVNALEAQIVSQSTVVDLFPTTAITYAPPNAAKCEASRRAVGHSVKMFYYWKQNWLLARAMVVAEVALVAILSGGLGAAIGGIYIQAAIELIFQWGQSQIDTFYSEFLAIAEDLICGVYEASTAQEAIDNYESIVDGQTWTDTESPEIVKLLKPITPINKVFSDPSQLEPEYYGGQELGDWTAFDCSSCTQEAADCPTNINELRIGTGVLFDGNGDPILNQTIRLTSIDPPESGHRIAFTFMNVINVQIVAQTDGATLSGAWRDCSGNVCLFPGDFTNANLPIDNDTVDFFVDRAIGDPNSEFYIDVVLTSGLSALDDCS